MSSKYPCVYMMASQKNGTLYIGVTTDLIKRVYEHKNNFVEGFTKKYSCHSLVYFELYSEIYDAISREKQMKNYSRAKKLALIEKDNPQWRDLYPTIAWS